MPEPERKRGGRAGAIAFLVIGLLILIPSGLCTGFFTIYPFLMSMFGGPHPRISADLIGFALTIGAPFMLIGGLLIVLGISKLRRR